MAGSEMESSSDGEVFEPTADGILRFVETTRPRPPEADVEAHIRELVREELIAPAELEKFRRAGYSV